MYSFLTLEFKIELDILFLKDLIQFIYFFYFLIQLVSSLFLLIKLIV